MSVSINLNTKEMEIFLGFLNEATNFMAHNFVEYQKILSEKVIEEIAADLRAITKVKEQIEEQLNGNVDEPRDNDSASSGFGADVGGYSHADGTN